MGTQPLQPLFLLDDEPIISADDDFLTREDDARTIAGAVLGTTGPFSVGIYGEWGTGKTSLLHHVKSLLEAKDPANPTHLAYPYLVPVFFNAWQHEKDAEPLAHLAEAVDAAITTRLFELETVTDKVEAKARSWLRSAHMAARSIVSGVTVNLKVGEDGPGLDLAAEPMVERYEQLQKEMENADSAVWKTHVSQSVSRAVLRSFRTKHELLDKVRPGEERRIPRVVIFIDDMDRCLAEDAFKLLQAIKLALAQPGFIFVMTLDPLALQPFLENKLGKFGAKAADGSRAIYLDKLIQLPYSLRLHDEQFSTYVHNIVHKRLKQMLVAPADMAKVDNDSSIAPQWQVFKQLARVLDLASQRNPRTLVRRINTLLTDARVAPLHVKAQLDEDQAKAEGIFVGLCLVRHTLRHFVEPHYIAELSSNSALCLQILSRGLSTSLKRAQALVSQDPNPPRSDPLPGTEGVGIEISDGDIMAARDLLRELNRVHCLDALFQTGPGQRWLAKPDERTLVDTFYAKRPEKKPESPPTSVETAATETQSSPNGTTLPSPESSYSRWLKAGRAVPDGERQLIERVICGALNLPFFARLGPGEFSQVRKLRLVGDPITDAGLAWLAGRDSPLTELTTLSLGGTKVTDAGVVAIADRQSCFRGLNSLSFRRTDVTDRGIAALTNRDSPLSALSVLELSHTQMTDLGLASLTAKESPLTALTELYLSGTNVTDAGLENWVSNDSALTRVTNLWLTGTKVTNRGIAVLEKRFPDIRVYT